MLKRYTNFLPTLICCLLIGCASAPETDSGTPVAPPPSDVDSSTLAAYNKAVNAMKNGQENTAIEQFSAIAKTHPNLAGPFINLGLIYLGKNRYEDAEKTCYRPLQSSRMMLWHKPIWVSLHAIWANLIKPNRPTIWPSGSTRVTRSPTSMQAFCTIYTWVI